MQHELQNMTIFRLTPNLKPVNFSEILCLHVPMSINEMALAYSFQYVQYLNGT